MSSALSSASFLLLLSVSAFVSAQLDDSTCNAAKLTNKCYKDANWTLYIQPSLDAQNNTILDVRVKNTGVANMVNRWMAVAFSNDSKMGNNVVIGCASYNNAQNLVADYSYNDATPTNTRIPGWTQANTDSLLTLVQSSIADHSTFCQFQFKLNSTLTGVNSQYLLDASKKTFWALLASGPTNSTSNPGVASSTPVFCLLFAFLLNLLS